ncbi:MAG: S8 family serine peptidase [Gammaproteobacteria bacterium]
MSAVEHNVIRCIVAIALLVSSSVYGEEKSRLGSTQKPIIAGYDKSSCYKSGDKIIIAGKNFGDRKVQGIAIGGNGIHVDIKNILQWSNTRITAILPSDSRIQAKRYYIGVEQTNHNKWLSNINTSFVFCNPPTPTTGGVFVKSITIDPPKPDPRKTLTLGSNDRDDNGLGPDGASNSGEGRENGYYESFDSSSSKERSYGSLISKGLPEAPKVLIKESENKSSEHREPQEAMVASADMESAIELATYLSQYNITVKRRKFYSNLGIVISILRIPDGESVPDTINAIRQDIPDLWVDENQRYTLLASYNKRYGQAQIGWTNKHKSCGHKVKLGLIDTEITNHPALNSQEIINQSFLTAGVKPAPFDHGTAIAGILVGKETSDEFHGLLPNATLYSASIFRLREKNKIDTSAELVITALDWLAGEDVKVINLSFGGPRNLILELVLSNLIVNGHTIVSAAGSLSKNGPPLYPAAQDGVFAVNAVDANQRLFNKATKGDYIDFSGPGVDIWVASPNGSGKYLSGSSFAAPFITAAAAIINKDSQEIYQELKQQVKDLGPHGKDSEYGWGLVNASKSCAE